LIGGLVSAGATAFYQYYTNGEVNGRDVAAGFAGGFVSGFAATATLGL